MIIPSMLLRQTAWKNKTTDNSFKGFFFHSKAFEIEISTPHKEKKTPKLPFAILASNLTLKFYHEFSNKAVFLSIRKFYWVPVNKCRSHWPHEATQISMVYWTGNQITSIQWNKWRQRSLLCSGKPCEGHFLQTGEIWKALEIKITPILKIGQ